MRTGFAKAHRVAGMLALASALPVACSAAPKPADGECYDAEVSATILRQTPSVIPGCDDCFIMRWPWIIDIDVRRVHELRRNAAGGFNVMGFRGEDVGGRCPAGTPPAAPFITPGEGRTLDDLRREGEREYRPRRG